MSAMIPPDIVQDGVAYWKADKVSAYFGGSPTVGTLGVWRYRGEGPKNSSSSAANASTANAIPAASPTRSGR